MELIKQLKLLTLQVIISLIFLNTQIGLAQNSNKWSEGSYVGVSLIFNTIKAGDARYDFPSGGVDGQIYDAGRESSKGIKIGYNKMLTDNIFVGPEFSFSKEKSLDFNDGSNGGVIDTLRFKDNYNIGLRVGYAVGKDIAYVLGYGRTYLTVESSMVDAGVDIDKINTDLNGYYRNFGILFNLGSGYNLELLHQINSIKSTINLPAAPSGRIPQDITINHTKSTSITISKFF